MDNAKLNELYAVYQKNINKGQRTKVILYNITFVVFSVICALILYAVNYLVGRLGGNLWATLFVVVALLLLMLCYGTFKKLPFINTKKFFFGCIIFAFLLTGVVWLVFFVIRIALKVYTSEEILFVYTKVKDWMVFPLCYSLVTIGILFVSLLCFKTCKRCSRRGFGLGAKNNYVIEKISKEHIDSVRREKPSAELGEVEVYYDTYYKNYEYRFYRHYCAVCGNIVHEKMRKVQCKKKYLSKLEVFSDAELTANQKRIESSKEYFAKKEAKTMNKLYAIFEKKEKAKQEAQTE